MRKNIKIYVSLLDEGLDVRRPVMADQVGKAIYRIIAQPYDQEIETWEYEPGDDVVCKMVESSDGKILAAIRRA
jgi:hypothetical protein